jgi:hypothetical protein
VLRFIPILAAVAFCYLSQALALAADKPLNILILYADDWRYDTLGIAGNAVVQTPHLDQLARDGVRFTRACVTTAICGVSRASLFTGQWMSRHGNTAFQAFHTPWDETYPGVLRKNGYYVGHVGKWHNGQFPADKFDFGRAYSGTHWITEPDGIRIHVTQKNENDALEFLLTRPTGQPFCLTLAFFATHAEDKNPLQYLPQPGSMSLYQGVHVPVPVNATDESFHRLPAFIANEANESRVRWHWRFDTPEKFQTMMKNYYRLATEVDSTCQRVLDELKKQGLLDNTLVIFTGDNGYYHAEHGLADKWKGAAPADWQAWQDVIDAVAAHFGIAKTSFDPPAKGDIDRLYPDLSPSRFGHHLTEAWGIVRAAHIFEPWYEANAAYAVDFDPSDLEPERLVIEHRALIRAVSAKQLAMALSNK